MNPKKKPFDVYMFLTHAIWHCLYMSAPTERGASEADHEAAGILTELRSQVAREKAEVAQ